MESEYKQTVVRPALTLRKSGEIPWGLGGRSDAPVFQADHLSHAGRGAGGDGPRGPPGGGWPPSPSAACRNWPSDFGGIVRYPFAVPEYLREGKGRFRLSLVIEETKGNDDHARCLGGGPASRRRRAGDGGDDRPAHRPGLAHRDSRPDERRADSARLAGAPGGRDRRGERCARQSLAEEPRAAEPELGADLDPPSGDRRRLPRGPPAPDLRPLLGGRPSRPRRRDPAHRRRPVLEQTLEDRYSGHPVPSRADLVLLQRPPADRRAAELLDRHLRAVRGEDGRPALLSLTTGGQPAGGRPRRDRLGRRPHPLLGPHRRRPPRRALRQPRAGRTVEPGAFLALIGEEGDHKRREFRKPHVSWRLEESYLLGPGSLRRPAPRPRPDAGDVAAGV